MCGFGGEIRFDAGVADREAVLRMSPCLQSRGPDGDGSWARGPVALVHHRLKVIDLSEAGAQPMELEGLVLVFNGCIYNHEQLRGELERLGHRFVSTSDTEVVLRSYREWGTRCVDRFLGMFAFALVDPSTGRTVLARDRLGIKPLYYSEGPSRLRFASTLPALLAAGEVDTTVDPVALHHYMSWHSVVPPPRTILTGVRKLPPATVRTIESDGSFVDEVYWEPAFERTSDGPDSAEKWRDAVLDALRTAVRRRTVADVPVGVLLSGGLDSSLLVALLAEMGHPSLETFSIGFPPGGGEEGDEFLWSDLVSDHYGTKHSRFLIEAERLLPAVDSAIDAMSEPMVSHDCVAFYLLSQEVSREVTVVQCGQGADELFAGYSWYPPIAEVPRDLAADAYAGAFFDRDQTSLAGLVSEQWLPEGNPSREFLDAHFARPGAQTALDAALRIDSTVMLVDDPVKRVDTMSMAFGLEARVPFLDHELVELAARCPSELKLADGGKGILKAVARGLVPDAVIDRPKGSFPVPGIRHLHGPLLERVRAALLAPAATERGLFRSEAVQRLLADPNTERTAIDANVLWQLGLLEMWLQAHVD